MITSVISIIEIILGAVLILMILMQSKGTGLGSAFGGEVSFYRTKRGVEKMLFYGSIIVAVLFFISAIAGFLL